MTLTLIAILTLGAIGFVFGAGLAVAHKKLAVEVDPLEKEIIEMLPEANCGACGFAGCEGYAHALAQGGVEVNKCPVGGSELAQKLAKLLGQEVTIREQEIAVILCKGGRDKCVDKFNYDGVLDCKAAMLLSGGPKSCSYGCIGFDSCVRVCKFDAMRMGDDGIPIIDEEKCVGCGMCVIECPKNIIELTPKTGHTRVFCSSTDKGPIVRKYCKVGCIACNACVKVCEYDAIAVSDFLAKIDYQKCTNCGKCVEVCPTKCIIMEG